MWVCPHPRPVQRQHFSPLLCNTATAVFPPNTHPQIHSHHKSGSNNSSKWLEVRFVNALLVNRVDKGAIGDEKEDQGRDDAFYDAPRKDMDVEQGVLDARQI